MLLATLERRGELVFIIAGGGWIAAPSLSPSAVVHRAPPPPPKKLQIEGSRPPDGPGMAVVTSGAWECSRSYEISPVRPRAGLQLGEGEQGLERES